MAETIKCPYWDETKLMKKTLKVSETCTFCGLQKSCDVLKDILQDIKPTSKIKTKRTNTEYEVLCKKCKQEARFCRCKETHGFFLSKKGG